MSYAFLCRTFYLKCKFVRFFSYDSFAIVEISYIDSISILQLSIFGRRTEFLLHWIGSQRHCHRFLVFVLMLMFVLGIIKSSQNELSNGKRRKKRTVCWKLFMRVEDSFEFLLSIFIFLIWLREEKNSIKKWYWKDFPSKLDVCVMNECKYKTRVSIWRRQNAYA